MYDMKKYIFYFVEVLCYIGVGDGLFSLLVFVRIDEDGRLLFKIKLFLFLIREGCKYLLLNYIFFYVCFIVFGKVFFLYFEDIMDIFFKVVWSRFIEVNGIF